METARPGYRYAGFTPAQIEALRRASELMMTAYENGDHTEMTPQGMQALSRAYAVLVKLAE